MDDGTKLGIVSLAITITTFIVTFIKRNKFPVEACAIIVLLLIRPIFALLIGDPCSKREPLKTVEGDLMLHDAENFRPSIGTS
jgi:multisubunit Na+/H+ antiporter MnhG subunit